MLSCFKLRKSYLTNFLFLFFSVLPLLLLLCNLLSLELTSNFLREGSVIIFCATQVSFLLIFVLSPEQCHICEARVMSICHFVEREFWLYVFFVFSLHMRSFFSFFFGYDFFVKGYP